MNSELEAIMRRRRRKADGLPGSPSPNRKSNKGDESSPRSSRKTSTRQGSPPPLPPPSSVSSTRRAKLSMRRTSVPLPPPSEAVSPPNKKDASTRRRALDQIRGGRRTYSTPYSQSTSEDDAEKQQAAANDSMVAVPGTPSHNNSSVNDSILTQGAVVHGISDISKDESIMTASGIIGNDSMDIVVSAPTDESLMKQEDAVKSPAAASLSSPETSDVKSPTYSSSPEKSVRSSPLLSSPEKSVRSSPLLTSPQKSVRSSPLSSSTSSVKKEPSIDSSVESPQKSLEKEPEKVEDSSSEEEEVSRLHESEPIMTTEPISTSFAQFEADFGNSFPTNAFSNEEYEPPPDFAANQYEPPPLFPAFEPLPEPVDYTPLENVPTRAKPEITLVQQQVISGGKVYHCRPTTNPLNGNVITCRTTNSGIRIQEIQVKTGAQVEYTNVLTQEVQKKFKTTYGTSAFAVSKVMSITSGVHRSQGQARVRVAALVEFQALNQSGKEVLRTVLLVWQWGYGANKPVALQSLLSPPNKASFTYDAESLQIADGLVFLSGTAKNKGPCVFCVKPNIKDVWSANLMPGTGTISSIAVTSHGKYKYIAVAQTDGSLCIWTYETAVDRKGAEAPKTLFPLCRLYGASAIPSSSQTVGDEDASVSEEKGYCTNLAWTGEGGMLLLAAAFTHGMAVYHVSLPLLKEGDATKPISEPMASTQLSQTALLPSFVAARWASPMERASVSWVELGPNPCLSFLLKKEATVKVVVGVVNLPLYGHAVEEKSASYPFTVLASSVFTSAENDSSAMDLVGYRSVTSTLLHKSGSITTLSPMLSSDSSFFRMLGNQTMSAAPGLDSAGYTSLSDAASESDGILQIFSVKQCKRELTELPSPVPETQRLDWTPPKQRYLLCRSFVGDTKVAQDPSPEVQRSAEYGDIESVTCGNYINLICDINMVDLVPRRIVRCKGSDLCAVLLYRGVEHHEGPSTNAVSIALIDTSKGELVGVQEGRDICFLPDARPSNERALVLSVDGSSISVFRRIAPSDENEESTWEQSDPSRALLGVEADEEYVEGSRLVLLSLGEELALLVVGTRVRDERSCLLLGKYTKVEESDADGWKSLVPSTKRDPVCWLDPKETIQSLVNLPSYQDGQHLLATATSSRLILLSLEMKVVAQVATQLASASLAPLGSHTVAFCSRDSKLRYLCSLDGKFSSGLLATLPSSRVGHENYQLLAVRPDRFVYTNTNNGVRLVEQDENAHKFPLPTALTKPAMLLEPMVANALCESKESTDILRAVIERFGRKVAPFPHGDDEGIGSAGTGLTPAVLEMLSAHGLKHPASWLLTGSCRFERSANSRVLPPWMPVNSKAAAALSNDAYLHIVANGDQYFSDYVKSPDHNMASTLPRPSDPSAVVSHELARKAMQNGDVAGALKMLDVAGTSSSDSALLQLALSLQLDQSLDVTSVLKTLSGQSDDGHARSASQLMSTTSSLAALALDLKSRQVNGKVPQQGGEFDKTNDEFRRRHMARLAPSVQRSRKSQRVRHRLIGEAAMDTATRGIEKVVEPDSRWQNTCNESKHVWNEGPQKEKENLLLLDRMEEWLGRKRPAVLGKEGAEAALERGEKTLADILNRANDYDDNSFCGESVGDGVLLKDGWVECVGEGRSDEDNLSFYLRMSEGADEDSTWRADGLVDLTLYGNKATVLGHRECFSLQPTASSVDEGQPGKVKLLYDLVFEAPKDGEGPGGLLVEAPRGSSLDVGMLHGDAHDVRRRCSLEFWYRLPVAESVTDEIVLARRSVNSPGDDTARLSVASDNDGFLWELVLLPSGELEFRSNGGTSLLSSSESSSEFEPNSSAMGDFGDDTHNSNDDGGLVTWERPEGGGGWNHVCLVFSSRRQQSQSDCAVKMFMKGTKVASTLAKIMPPGLGDDELKDANSLDEAMKKTVYLFGLNAVPDYRMTEIRLWSCERSEDDIKMMMYEYLRAAETKKKFKVKIRNKRGDDAAAAKPSTGGLLSPPPTAGGLLSPPRDNRGTKSLLPPRRARPDVDTATTSPTPLDGKNYAFDASFRAFGNADENEALAEKEELLEAESKFTTEQKFLPEMTVPPPPPKTGTAQPESKAIEGTWSKMQNEDALLPVSGYSRPQDIIDLQDTAEALETLPATSRLSREVRSSAAAALIRGPPATRHFGGNRGGLSRASPADRNVSKRFGVGAIAICGAEKTVVYDHDQEPKGKTYPIGASGAVISDEMDNGEYLCCFLAKDKRMVVFELLTRTVVVELQMTTKLNFWRYLPPQAHGHTLVFMLVTPVGGFHWVPLDESPRPIQVWKRGPALQGKKIVTYEEGGSNGFGGAAALSVVALLLVSTASTGTPLEAWILQVGGESQALCVSDDVLGAALFRPYHIEDEAFLPHLVTATGVESEIVLKVEPLSQNPATGELAVEDVSIGAIIDQSQVRRTSFTPPALAMGGWPEVVCCTSQGFVVACVRRKGLVVAYDCQEELVLVRQEHVENYIVDGALRPGSNGNGDVELVLLLADSENPRDGFVMSIDICR